MKDILKFLFQLLFFLFLSVFSFSDQVDIFMNSTGSVETRLKIEKQVFSSSLTWNKSAILPVSILFKSDIILIGAAEYGGILDFLFLNNGQTADFSAANLKVNNEISLKNADLYSKSGNIIFGFNRDNSVLSTLFMLNFDFFNAGLMYTDYLDNDADLYSLPDAAGTYCLKIFGSSGFIINNIQLLFSGIISYTEIFPVSFSAAFFMNVINLNLSLSCIYNSPDFIISKGTLAEDLLKWNIRIENEIFENLNIEFFHTGILGYHPLYNPFILQNKFKLCYLFNNIDEISLTAKIEYFHCDEDVITMENELKVQRVYDLGKIYWIYNYFEDSSKINNSLRIGGVFSLTVFEIEMNLTFWGKASLSVKFKNDNMTIKTKLNYEEKKFSWNVKFTL